MKLRNKKTGEIRPAEAREDGIYLYNEITEQWFKYELDLLAKWWEYYEEPKDIWWLDNEGCVNHASGDVNDSFRKNRKIGNYFLSREEAEKAVEKLKAWKRLKDKGFRFEGWDNTDRSTIHNFSLFVTIEDLDSINKDLDLLFGGEE